MVVEAFEIYVSHTGLVEVGGGLGEMGRRKTYRKRMISKNCVYDLRYQRFHCREERSENDVCWRSASDGGRRRDLMRRQTNPLLRLSYIVFLSCMYFRK